MIAANFFTDDNMAKFFIALGVDMEDKPHDLKAARAAMNEIRSGNEQATNSS